MKSVTEIVLGIDIGGSHITVALVDLTCSKIIDNSCHRKEVDAKGTAAQILSSWCSLINLAYKDQNNIKKRIGISMPGPFDYDEGICLIEDQDKFRSLFKLNLKKELAARLAMDAADVKFLNDAAAFLKGEVYSGAARNSQNAIGITLGTGLGSAFYREGKALDAALWQSPFKKGIAEDYLSTRWFLKRYHELTGLEVKGVKELNGLQDQEKVVQTIFEEFGNHLAEFLIPIIAQQGAHDVVLGGNIANAHAHFMPYLVSKLNNNKVQHKITKLQESATLLGEASYWAHQKSDVKI